MEDVVELALVGCGGIAGAHRNGYQALWERGLRGFRIAATCDTDRGRAEAMAAAVAAFQGRKPVVYSEVSQLLEEQDAVTAVDICAVHSAHHELAVACLDAGRHVTIEKPLAITLRAGRLILDAAARSGKVLQVAENYRRAPEMRAVRWAIQEGRIGRVQMAYWLDAFERLWHWGWREQKAVAGGGWTLDGGVHFADLLRYQVGEVRRVTALVEAFHPTRCRDRDRMADPESVDVEDSVLGLLEFESGAVGQWLLTNAARGKGFSVRAIYGDRGSIHLGDGLYGSEGAVPMATLISEYMAALSHQERDRLFPAGLTDGIATELHEFILAMRGDGRVETDGHEGYRSQAVCAALYESAALGRPVDVAEVSAGSLAPYQDAIDCALGLV